MSKLIKRRLLIEKGFPKNKLGIIHMAYENIKDKYNWSYNIWSTRAELMADLLSELGTEFLVKCNGENNTPNIIDLNCMVATIYYDHNKKYGYYQCVHLIFGPAININTAREILYNI